MFNVFADIIIIPLIFTFVSQFINVKFIFLLKK